MSKINNSGSGKKSKKKNKMKKKEDAAVEEEEKPPLVLSTEEEDEEDESSSGASSSGNDDDDDDESSSSSGDSSSENDDDDDDDDDKEEEDDDNESSGASSSDKDEEDVPKIVDSKKDEEEDKEKSDVSAAQVASSATTSQKKGPQQEDQDDEEPLPPSSSAPPAPEKATTSEMMISDGRYRNKQRCLILCLRGATARQRHLLEDLRTLVPHHKKESKLDAGKHGAAAAVYDIARMRGCNTVLFLECRKHQDAYLWMGRIGETMNLGPSVKFHVSNIHTMDELRLTGNCMRGSRPILNFSHNFDDVPHLRLLKYLFSEVFAVPRGHPKSKPFVDRIMSFYYADNKIWVRNYQILESQPTNALEARRLLAAAKKAKSSKTKGETTSLSLVEIGPRFVLDPIRIFRGSFGGQTLYQNSEFVSPNEIRAIEKKKKGDSYKNRKESQKRRKTRHDEYESSLPVDPLDSLFK